MTLAIDDLCARLEEEAAAAKGLQDDEWPALSTDEKFEAIIAGVNYASHGTASIFGGNTAGNDYLCLAVRRLVEIIRDR